MGLTWLIARKQVIDSLRGQGEDVAHWDERLYINVDCYDKSNAESILFDVVTELQTNDLLIADFGQLYNQPRSKDEATLKRVSNFVTNNRIRVAAHTALTPMRGRLYQQHRPDFILRDDLENAITADSPVITEKIIRLLDEAKGGIAGHGVSLTLGNFIIENGVMGYVRKAVDGSGGRPIHTHRRPEGRALLARQIRQNRRRCDRCEQAISSIRANAKYRWRVNDVSSTRADAVSTKSKCFWTQSRPVPRFSIARR